MRCPTELKVISVMLSSSLKPINLMIIDDHQLRRECLVFALTREHDLSVSTADSVLSEVVAKAERQRSDLILFDACQSDGNTLELIREIRENLPAIKLVVTGLSDAKGSILDWIEAGANGYLLKDGSLKELIEVIRSVHANGVLCSPRLAYSTCSRVAELARKRSSVDLQEFTNLTRRELEILRLLAEGLSSEQMAKRLFLSPYTIKNHVHNILEKLQAHSRLEAVRLASQKGLLKESARPAK